MDVDSAQPIFISGINGFVGGHLAERLLKNGFSVRGLARSQEKAAWLSSLGIEIVSADLLDPTSLAEAIQGCRTIIHLAAWTENLDVGNSASQLAWQTNVDGTINLLAAARSQGVNQFVHVSSTSAYGVTAKPLIDENVPCIPVGHIYPDSKAAAEVAVRASGLPWVIVRPAHIYGPGDRESLKFLDQIRAGKVVISEAAPGLLGTVYIDNLIDAVQLIINRKDVSNQIFNICDERSISHRELYSAYAQMLGMTIPYRSKLRTKLSNTLAADVLRRILGKEIRDRWQLHNSLYPLKYSIENAQLKLGYTPKVSFEEGMSRKQKWLQENGYLS